MNRVEEILKEIEVRTTHAEKYFMHHEYDTIAIDGEVFNTVTENRRLIAALRLAIAQRDYGFTRMSALASESKTPGVEAKTAIDSFDAEIARVLGGKE